MMDNDFEASFHFGFLLESLEDLERIVLDLQDKAENDPDLKGRLKFGFNRAMAGNPEIDARLDASPSMAMSPAMPMAATACRRSSKPTCSRPASWATAW